MTFCESLIISIHALLAESDHAHAVQQLGIAISIHALLAESDKFATVALSVQNVFLSTLSSRRATSHVTTQLMASDNFYPRSPRGERRYCCPGCAGSCIFLSTLSSRRAT